MYQNIDDKNNSYKADLVFDGINFISGLIALAAVKSGIRVAVKIPQKINMEFQPEISFYYPKITGDVPASIKNYRFLLKCSSLFPWLFFPQRVLFFNLSGTINARLNNIADRLLHREREWAALPVNCTKYKAYSPVSEAFPHGTLVYEYRFDREGALFELIQMCHEAGALIVQQGEKIKGTVTYTSISFRKKSRFLTLKKLNWPYPNSINIESKSMFLTFQGVKRNTIIGIYPRKVNIGFNTFKTEIETALEGLKFNITEDLTSDISEIYFSRQKETTKNSFIIEDANLFQLRQTFYQLTHKISNQLGKPIKADSLFTSYKQNGMTAPKFRRLQDKCDEKFDLAKQTGIAYTEFAQLFYRYGQHIDEMIELAYNLMARMKNSEQIWKRAEEEMLKNWYYCKFNPT